jgi:hypothetical protein
MEHPDDCCQSTNGSPERNRYFAGKLLTERDFSAEQSYFRNKLRRHNRLVHGVGVVCGLELRPAGDLHAPWQVEISPGCALGPYGDEILVCEPVRIDLASCCPPPQHPGSRTRSGSARIVVFVTVQYAEVPCAPALTPSAGTGSDGGEPTRIRESFEICCSADSPPSPGSAVTLCELLRRNQVPQCTPCPGDPRLVLARVTLPTAPSALLRARDIDNSVRRPLFSLLTIQEQLIRCCCASAPGRKNDPSPHARAVATARKGAQRRRAAARRAR